jgi:hypothetical protein
VLVLLQRAKLVYHLVELEDLVCVEAVLYLDLLEQDLRRFRISARRWLKKLTS